jgi:sugar (pentulose or hexulose) kinase
VAAGGIPSGAATAVPRLPAARVIPWSGDNPCSLVGSGLVREGRLAISLGTKRHGVRDDARSAVTTAASVRVRITHRRVRRTVHERIARAQRVRILRAGWAASPAALASTPPGNQAR